MAYGDGAGRLTAESLAVNYGTAITYATQSQYDAAGRRMQILYPDGGTITRSYDARDQLSTIGYNGNVIDTRTYDNGRRISGETLGNGVVNAFTYRLDNLVSAINVTNLPSLSYSYTYDVNKNKLSETIGGTMSNFGFNSATYDNEDRVTAWHRKDYNNSQSWTLSNAGDWTSFTQMGTTVPRTHNAVHELTAIGSAALAYDVKGNLTADNSRSPSQAYTWNYDNRLASAVVSGNTHSYAYDVLGRRVSKTVMTGGSSTATTVFVSLTKPIDNSPYAGQVVAEYTANAAASSPSKKYIHADYIDEPVVMLNVSGGSETKYYYHRNSLYSIVGLTDTTGSVVEYYCYSGYGVSLILAPNTIVRSSSSYGNAYMFTGREYDAETGLYNYRARPYSPLLGRFIGRDPIGYLAGDPNIYRCVRNKPLTNTDPTGLCDKDDEIKKCKANCDLKYDAINVAMRGECWVWSFVIPDPGASQCAYEQCVNGFRQLSDSGRNTCYQNCVAWQKLKEMSWQELWDRVIRAIPVPAPGPDNNKEPRWRCFLPGTLVGTFDGPVPIERITVGTRVWSFRAYPKTPERFKAM